MPRRDAQFTYTPEDAGHLLFAWDGGQYIDIFTGDDDHPSALINVMDMDGTLTIERTPEAFRARVDEWLADES